MLYSSSRSPRLTGGETANMPAYALEEQPQVATTVADTVEIGSTELTSQAAKELFHAISSSIPNTNYFNPVREKAAHFFSAASIGEPALAYFPLKPERLAHDANIVEQNENCKSLSSRLKDCKQTLQDFFITQQIPNESAFKELKAAVNSAKTAQISVLEWANREIPRLRKQVKKGMGIQLTAEQKEFNDYQLRSILPKAIIEAMRQHSDLKHTTRQARLAKLEHNWNALTLVQLKNSEDVEIISTFLPILPKLTKLTTEAKALAEAAVKLRTESEVCNYALKSEVKRQSINAEPSTPDTLEVSVAKSQELKQQHLVFLEEVINNKKDLRKRLEALNAEKSQLQKEIEKILEVNKKFNLENCNHKSPVLGYFIPSEADPKEKIDTHTKEIFETSYKEMDVLCTALVNQWNALCVHHYTIQQELLLAERIQDVKPQLAEIAGIAGSLYSDARNMRKSETQYKEAVTKFAKIIEEFKNLSATLTTKNSYICSRVSEEFQSKGFKELYHRVINEINDSLAVSKSAVTESTLKDVAIILYNAETSSLAKKILSAAFAEMADVQQRIGNSIETKYNFLKTDTFAGLEFEMWRSDRVHTAIAEYIKYYAIEIDKYTKSPAADYSSETVDKPKFTTAKMTGYPPKYPSPLG